MASTSSTSFERSLDQFRSHLSKDEKREFSNANLQDLNATIQQMLARLGRDKRLCNFERIEKFLDGMKHIEQLVSIFLNVHEVVAFVWGPIKLALMAATVWTDSIKQLLDTYEEIGEALSNLAFFHTLIKSNGAERLKRALEDYFSDVLRFHHCVLGVFSRPNWKTFFKAAWGSFRRQIEPIIRALQLRQEKLSHERLQSHAIHQGVQDFRGHADDRRQTSAKDQEMKDFVEDKLNISNFGLRSRLDSPEPSCPSAGDWIFHHPDFQAWERGTSPQGSVLFLNGSPGAGKTTLAIKVIRHLTGKDRSSGSTVYFLFKHDDDDRRSAKPMLRAILAQLSRQDETIMRYLYEKTAPMSSNLELSSLTTLQDLSRDCLTSHRTVCVVLDGLDECSENEPGAIITWFLDKVLPFAASRGCHLKLLICGQRDGRLDQLLSAQPQIRLDTVDSHHRDIEDYSKSRAAEICARFSQTSEQEEELATRVVMSIFLSMDSIDEFEDEMQSDRFPQDLDKAYERIVQRVLENSKPSRQKSVKKILGWVICSQRPLRWREIQSRFCIDAEKGACNPKRRRLDNCKDICSSLVDVMICEMFGSLQSEQIIQMVHETASRYLVQRGTIDVLQEHAGLALFCCRYLSSRPFLQDPETQKYASRPPADVVSSVVGLLTAYSDNPSNQSILEVEACPQTVANTLRTENIDALVQSRVVVVRAAGESQHRNLSNEGAYLDLSGPLRFKCPRLYCSKFSAGFRSQNTRDEHLNRHERPYRCTHSDCFLHDVGCESRERLEAHHNAFHRDSPNLAVTFPSTKKTRAKNIFDACRRGSLEEVRRFHLSGAELNENEGRGSSGGTESYVTPLYIATQAGHADVCKYIIDQGINPFEEWNYRRRIWSSMLEAIRRANAPIVELFLHAGYEADITYFPRYLAVATLADHRDTLELLLGWQSLLDHAVTVEQLAQELLASTSDIKHWPRNPPADSSLVYACFRRAYLNLYRDNIPTSGARSLIKDPGSAEYRACKALLQSNHGPFLHWVLGSKCHPLSMFILDFVDEDDLQVTAYGGNRPIHMLARLGCNRGDCKNCAIIARRVIEIDGGVSVNTPNKDGSLPIHIALATPPCSKMDPEEVNLRDRQSKIDDAISVIVEACRLDSSIRNHRGQTIFSVAAGTYWIDAKTLDSLLKIDPTLAWTADDTEDRQTPLHYAMRAASTSTIQAWKATLLLSCREVRRFAKHLPIERAVTIMDELGFGL
ncbi:hypothetical protein LCI18_003526 [Fusarium solani-melongenae]|uniref:Uncharacterized protein n=1 Tax=Fusarium solani subsp. cucurbitae TaxID=2747967 RepID=A0ACD3YUH5_FUSSC|nr:hypothetical protein LCI18_003526 [Fusarium solani-melongenae]